jgi:surface-anchored protein
MKLSLIHSLLTAVATLALCFQSTHSHAALPDPLAFTFETFDVDGGTETLLSDIRNDGTLVGRYKDSGGISQGFVQEGTNRTVFNVTGTTATFPGGIDSVGRVAGFYRNATNPAVQHGFIRETNGVITTIDGPDQTFTYVWRINDAGRVNGNWFEDPFFITSFTLATNGALTTNVFAGSPIGTVARGMNEAGDTAGWKWDENFTLQGVIFAGGATNIFTVPGWEHTLPGDINNLGEIAGTVNNSFTNTAGFFRRANGDTVIFNSPGAVEVEVFGLNDLGQVVGEYADAGGNRHGFIAHPAVKLPSGHTDIGVAYEDGAFDLHIHDEETDTEYGPDGAVLCVGEAAEQVIPDTAALSFLGRPGYSTWILPAVENTNLLFLGFGAEEIESGVFINDVLRMELVSVVGAGDFAVFAYDGFGNPIVHMNSADGINAADFFPLVAGGHTDLNWAFNAPGTYRIGFRARGTLVVGNQEVVSDIAYYTFVVPEPLLPQPAEPDDSLVYKIVDLGTLGGGTSRAFRINEQGHMVGEAQRADGSSGAWLWTNGVMVDLGALGGTNSVAFGLNEQGQVVGRAQNAAGRMKAFTWDAVNGMVEAPGLGGTGSFDSSLYAINDSGFAVGQARNLANQLQAFYWSNGVSTAVPLPGGSNSRAWDVNGAGQLSGWGRDASNAIVGFRWSAAGGYEFVGNLVPGADVFAVGINTNGHIAGAIQKDFGHQPGSSNPPISRAFFWDGASLRDLGLPEGYDGAAGNYLNDQGWVAGVAYRFNASGQPAEDSAFLHKDGVNHELELLTPHGSGWHLQWAYDVNNRGEIVGWGLKDGHAQRRAFLARPATRLKSGHTDIGVLFEGGAFEFEVHSEDTDTEYSPDAAVLNLPPLTQTVVPTNAAYAFLGAAGAPVWVLPGVENPKLLFLGLAAEEIEQGFFVNDEVRFALKGVEGPGQFSLYNIDGFGVPQVRMNSGDGFDASDVKSIQAGSHEDFYWAFTSPGLYRVKFQASGTLVAGSQFIESEEVEFCFEVIGIETRLAITRSGGNATISFVTQDGLTYQLETAPTVTGPWTDEGAAFLGTGREKNITVPLNPGAAFFKMKATVGN